MRFRFLGWARRVATLLMPRVLLSPAATVALSAPQYFPDDQLVSDMAALSSGVYHLRNKVFSCHDEQSRNGTLIAAVRAEATGRWWWETRGGVDEPHDLFQLLLPDSAECLHYSHDAARGTQVLVARSTLHGYVAVSYAGTDDWRTLTSDGDLRMSDFGPGDPRDGDGDVFGAVPVGARVHRGFNTAVFGGGGYRTVRDCVAAARTGGNCDGTGGGDGDAAERGGSRYHLITTGHSLGAANSILLGAALHLEYPNEALRSINFGCPKVGNLEWSYWLDSRQPDRGQGDGGSYEVFRFVNKIDLIPRLPLVGVGALFSHAGHTLQITYGGEIEAYYDHTGDEDNGLAGVPFGWEASSYVFLPGALVSHIVDHYVENLAVYRSNQTAFERVEDSELPPLARVEDGEAEAVSSRA